MTVRNRITRTDTVHPDSLTAHPKNYRDHPTSQSEALQTALDRVGWIKRVIVNERTGRIIDGHLRVEEARKKGELVPVVYVDLSEREEALVLALIDPLAGEAATDDEKLKELLTTIRDTEDLDKALDDLLAEVARQGGVLLESVPTGAQSEGGPSVVVCPRCSHQW